MNSTQIEKNVEKIVKDFNRKEFIYELLIAYGISKTSITRLKKGDFNLSKIEGEVLYKKKVLFKVVASDRLLTTIDTLTKDEEELKHNPRFVIVTDYKTLLAKDTRTGSTLDTPVLELHKRYDFFLPWAGQEKYQSKNENHADRKASYEMAKLYDILVHENPNIYEDGGHNLNIFLSRLLFCFFAEDTGIFEEEGIFTNTLAQHTKADGSDVHLFLDRLFKVLNTKDNNDEPNYLQAFPYVNGGLFRDTIVSPKFSLKARKIILECSDLNWSEINPDIFGSMIQAVVNPQYRSGLGMHYTSVPNIMKVIEPLFLNELKEEFEKSKGNIMKLRKLIARISKIKIFDPACGSGNFLIISYKEIRKLEIEIITNIYDTNQQHTIHFPDVYTEIKLSQFYGIELDDFAHEMAVLSLWLAEHQMNKIFVDELHDYGKAKPILPLKEGGHITQGNSIRIDWEDVCPKFKDDEIYILGNPPYAGQKKQDNEQKRDLEILFKGKTNYKTLDYVSCWFLKGAQYLTSNIKIGLVSTNSICQGNQVGLLWPTVLKSGIVEIFFAVPNFKWTNNAKGNAGVTCSIIGMQLVKTKTDKFIYNDVNRIKANNINSYLIDGKDLIIQKSIERLSMNLPKMVSGNMALDDGHLMLTEIERHELLSENKNSIKFIKETTGALEFIRGIKRYCLWIENQDLEEATEISFIKNRIKACEKFRLNGGEVAKSLVNRSHQFRYRHEPKESQIIIPLTSSERRDYVPIGFLDKSIVVQQSAQVLYDPEPYVFGVITSKIHMVWIKAVGGRMRTDISYSVGNCYNTFPFPIITDKQKEQINLHVFEVLDARAKHSEKTLAQLYDPDKMPAGLKEAHRQLDLAIERCYRLKPFESDTERLEYLFKMYEEMITKNNLFQKEMKAKKVK